MAKKYYETLGISENASEKDIKKAFRELSKKWHPDKFNKASAEEKKNAEDKFKEINEAYQTLSDKEKKAKYDMYGDIDPSMAGGGPDISEIFKHMQNGFGGFGFNPFGGMNNGNHMERGTNVVINLHLSLKDIYNEVNKEIKYHRHMPCEKCNGTGSSDGKVHKCAYCNGTGMIAETRRNGYSTMISTRPCPHCNGTGRDSHSSTPSCPHCKGQGTTVTEEKISIKVDTTWLMGNKMVMENYGNISKDGIPGSLIINPIIDDNNGFTIGDGLNLTKEVDVPVLDCILGASIVVESIDGNINNVKIKQGAKDGDIATVFGKGLKFQGRVGDMKVVIRHKMPITLSQEDRATIEKLKEKSNFK